MQDDEKIDRLLEQMANRKRKLNPGNRPKDFKNPKNPPREDPKLNDQPIQKDAQRKNLPKEESKPQGKKKYIAKDTLKNNQINETNPYQNSRHRQTTNNYDNFREVKSPDSIPRPPREIDHRDRRKITQNNFGQSNSSKFNAQDWLDMIENDKPPMKKEFEKKNDRRGLNNWQKNENKFEKKGNNPRRQGNLEYKNQCDKYIKNSEKLQEKQEQLGIEVKKLKKYFLESQLIRSNPTKPTDISVMKSLDSPMIFIEYNYEGEIRYMILRQVSKGLADKNKIGDYCEVVKKIYDTHYFPVDIQYEKALMQFVMIKASDIKLYLALKKRKDMPGYKKQTQKMFYYSINQLNYVEFIFFDYMMRGVSFGEKFANQNRGKVDEDTFRTYEKFLKNVKSKEDADMINFGEEEVESQHQKTQKESEDDNPMFITKRCVALKKRLSELLETDISQFEEELERKNQQHLEMLDSEPSDPKEIQQLQKLGDQIDKINRILENFQSVKFQVDTQLSKIKLDKIYTKADLDFLQLSVKRMVFAKKQLDSDLPILGKKKEIFDLLEKNNLIILEGQTGSGKSTQLPQMLCEYYKLFENPQALPVLVTQPRKIATRSLSERVAQELEEKGGTFVDYVASGTKISNPKAKIIFKLDRLVLDELVESPTLDEYSCLVIDEAHERTISIDIILGLVKELLKKRDGFKVIITSASMEIALFEKYFKQKTLKVSGRMYPVSIKYMPLKEEDMVKKIEKAIDSELLTERNMPKDKYKGHILVFCADTAEIEALSEIFRKKLNHNVFIVIPLHGKLSPEDQKKAFSKTKQHKLIFASRIAETAITIDGVKVVIDPGWDREMQYDQKTKFSSMKLVQISQSSAKQRAGRAGRTQEGFCLRLYSEYQFQNRRFNKLPEIKNIALQTLVLRLKTLGINNVSKFDYIEKPDEEGMKTSIETLKMIGCLDEKENITSIGKFLVKIPIQPFLARSIIEGLLMESVIEKTKKKNAKKIELTRSIIQILCMVLSAGNLFRIQQNFRELAEKVKYKHFSHEKGDFFFLKNIYDQFKIITEYDRSELQLWLTDHFLIKKTLFQVKDLVREIQSILKQFQIDEREMRQDLQKCQSKIEKYEKDEDRILSCLTTSFAVNLCLYSGHPQIGYTYMTMGKLVTIYGTSCLSLLGICPKWILAYDFYQNKDGKLYCKVANEIDYDFMKNTVEDYVYEKYQISRLHNKNPFYKTVSYNLETLTMLTLKEYYERREYLTEKQLQFLKSLNLSFSETQNKVTAFIKCEQSQEKNKELLESQLERFIDDTKMKAMGSYNHNYIGNIFVMIGNGFQISKIDFKTTQTVFEVSNLDEEMFDEIHNDWEKVATNVEGFGKNKLKLYFDNEQDIARFNYYLDFCKTKQNNKMMVRTEIADIRKKVPQTKIYMHWFAGLSKNNIFVKFVFENDRKNERIYSKEKVAEITQKNMEYLIIAKSDLNKKQLNSVANQRPMRRRNLDYDDLPQRVTLTAQERKLIQQGHEFNGMRLAKSSNGVTVFSDTMDEIDLHRYFSSLISTNNISPLFQMPKQIKKFRDAERPACEWKDAKWIEDIQGLLSQVTDRQELCIRVWGSGNTQKRDEAPMTEYEKTWRIDMKAEIKTFDCNLLHKLKNKFDGKKGILGYEKFHVSSVFSQPVIAVGLKAFESLKDQFNYNVDNFKQEYPDIIIDFYVRQVFRNDKKSRVFITVSSENREHLLKPVRILNSLFTAKYITLLDSEFRYLNNNNGDILLEEIEANYSYNIYFGFDKAQRRLKLYCHDSLQNEIKAMLKEKLSELRYHDEIISYKGKNLKKVEELLKQKVDEIEDHNKNKRARDQKFLAYEIRFTNRNIKIMADLDTFYELKVSINNLKVERDKNTCPTCMCLMITPYKLFNCQHSFCWSCLESVIKEFKLGNVSQLKCPHMDENDVPCKDYINIYDVMKILSEQELQQIFDAKISKFVDEHLDKYVRCYSADCEQIFDKESLKNQSEIDCRLCGKYYCLKCKQPHKNYTCEEWSSRFDLNEKLMKEIGVKQCPKCQAGIQKNGGCKHMTCKCGAHICWDCGKVFATSNDCYDHLVKAHGGINGANYVPD